MEIPKRSAWVRLFLAAVALLAVATAPVSSALAGKGGGRSSQSLSIVPVTNQYGPLQYPVEQESPNFFQCGGSLGPVYCPFDPSTWVSNPTNCAWDIDDVTTAASGPGAQYLDAGVSTRGSLCVVSDGHYNFSGDPHAIFAGVGSPKPSLVVTVANDQGQSWTVQPVHSSYDHMYHYNWCHLDRYPYPVSWYPVIPNSNGGIGVVVTYTMTVSNPTSRQVKGVYAGMHTDGTTASFCGT